MFDHSSSTVRHTSGTENYYYVVKNLDPSESYFVRVLAYSAMGFSEPEMASELLSSAQSISVSFIETTGTVDFTETFAFDYSTSDGFSRITNHLSIFATPTEVTNELNQFAHVLVDR